MRTVALELSLLNVPILKFTGKKNTSMRLCKTPVDESKVEGTAAIVAALSRIWYFQGEEERLRTQGEMKDP